MCWNQYVDVSTVDYIAVCILSFFSPSLARKCYSNHCASNDEPNWYIMVAHTYPSRIYWGIDKKRAKNDWSIFDKLLQSKKLPWMNSIIWVRRKVIPGRKNRISFGCRYFPWEMCGYVVHTIYTFVCCVCVVVQQPSNRTWLDTVPMPMPMLLPMLMYASHSINAIDLFFKHVNYVCAYINSMPYMEIMLFVYMWEKFIK